MGVNVTVRRDASLKAVQRVLYAILASYDWGTDVTPVSRGAQDGTADAITGTRRRRVRKYTVSVSNKTIANRLHRAPLTVSRHLQVLSEAEKIACEYVDSPRVNGPSTRRTITLTASKAARDGAINECTFSNLELAQNDTGACTN